MPSRTNETDLGTALAAIADRLRVDATALRGLAHDASDSADSVDGRVKFGLAGDLDDAAGRLDLLRAALCRGCGLIDVAERVTAAAKAK